MSMTVAALYKRLGALIEAGHGRKPVAVNKTSFTHNCEDDGTVILDLQGVEGPIWIGTSDDDGGTKWNKDGTESGKQLVVLYGNNLQPEDRPAGVAIPSVSVLDKKEKR
jgi:hypothetical protein